MGKRVGGVLVVVLALVAFALLQPRLPQDQALVLSIQAPEQVREVELTWTEEGDEGSEHPSCGGLRLTYPGGAPSSVEHHLSAPPGAYRIEVGVTREPTPGKTVRTTKEYRVKLEGRVVTLFLGRPRS